MEENVRPFRPKERMAGAAALRASREPPAEVLEACRAGDRAGFEALFTLTSDQVYSLALHFLGDPSAAADVTQDVFVKLLVRVDQFRSEARFTTWLYRVVANTVLDHRRARRTLLPLDTPAVAFLVAPGASPEDLADRRERRTRLRGAVRRLPPRLRMPLLLRYVTQLSYEEIGEALRLSPGTVASRLFRAHRKLSAFLDEGGAG